MEVTSLGWVRSPWTDKFGVPRQPGLADVAATIELRGPWAVPEAVRGLEAASHLWIIFHFHQVPDGRWAPTVRPPRLGGNERKGVFASRSPFRPNPIGLSCVRFVDWQAVATGIDLHVRGADLVDATPVLDLKPYVPYADAPSGASHGWADQAPERLEVSFEPAAEAFLQASPDGSSLRSVVVESLALDPRPAFHVDPQRIYFLPLAEGLEVRFCGGRDQGLRVLSITSPRDRPAPRPDQTPG